LRLYPISPLLGGIGYLARFQSLCLRHRDFDKFEFKYPSITRDMEESVSFLLLLLLLCLLSELTELLQQVKSVNN